MRLLPSSWINVNQVNRLDRQKSHAGPGPRLRRFDACQPFTAETSHITALFGFAMLVPLAVFNNDAALRPHQTSRPAVGFGCRPLLVTDWKPGYTSSFIPAPLPYTAGIIIRVR